MKKSFANYTATECNATVARLSRMFDFINAPFELAHFILQAHESTTEHNHIDREVFICIDGVVKIQLDKKHIYTMTKNEIMLVDRYQFHQIINENDKAITMLSLSWA